MVKAEPIRRWQTRIWIGNKIDQPVTLFGSSLDDLRVVVRRWLEEHQPPFFSNASPSYQGLRRTSYLFGDAVRSGVPPGWHWLDDRQGPSRLNSFEQVVLHFLLRMLIDYGPDYQERAAWRRVPLHQIRVLRHEVCQNEWDWLRVEEELQDGWCILYGRLARRDEREVGQGVPRLILLGHPRVETGRSAGSPGQGKSTRENW